MSKKSLATVFWLVAAVAIWTFDIWKFAMMVKG